MKSNNVTLDFDTEEVQGQLRSYGYRKTNPLVTGVIAAAIVFAVIAVLMTSAGSVDLYKVLLAGILGAGLIGLLVFGLVVYEEYTVSHLVKICQNALARVEAQEKEIEQMTIPRIKVPVESE